MSERPVMMIAAVHPDSGRLTRLTASRLATQLSTDRQTLKHCNLDSLLAIVKTLVQSVQGLKGLKSLIRPPPSSTHYFPLLALAFPLTEINSVFVSSYILP